MKTLRLTVLALALLAVPTLASAQAPSIMLGLQDAGAKNISYVNVTCEPVEPYPNTVRCTFVSVTVRKVNENTCKVWTGLPKGAVFTKKSENEWESIQKGGHGWAGTVVLTIWKKAGPVVWNYREVWAGEPGCESSECIRPHTIEWRWDKSKPVMECKTIKGEE